MVNRIRGEAALEAGGRQYRLLLNLGALMRGISDAFEAAGLQAPAGEAADTAPFAGGAG